ncbi:hypothetical protein GLW08_09080 [Pontibacillus yanchengensis]|uniref:Uncharacterized protein n=2 Tax=Pontibacillus yanchengensis TaxID=462910 RepID=A0ACC7VFC6_9BACI|nr:hypothetical protein [Pontibacillus yanchengensis]MYL33442.1 hypothetical protein [Pontibacillus yanchengensis]MYL53492.1 hypothetical protein [Pontibacillus yanchengensis]
MGNERKKVIIDEIQYWRTHQLLPKEYCDFLLALYTEGEGADNSKGANRKLTSNFIQVFLLLLLLPISFLVIYFTELSIPMQLSVLIILLTFSYWSIIRNKEKNSLNIHIAMIVFLLILFLVTVYATKELIGSFLLLQIMILFHCVLWSYIGIKRKLYYLTASGIIGCIIWAIYIFF